MRVDKTKWEHNLISDCIKTVKVKDAIQKKDYQQYGKYPIISQEKDFISGYCDTIENLNSIGEVVIFGDHTRVLKYVDFDFCVGADGVKVIQSSSDISAKYLFYFLKWADIPSNGYSRHFKFLKELIISFPSLLNQQAIVAELDALQAIIDGYKAQIADLDTLAQSIFLNTFGDPVSNPKGWDTELIKKVTHSRISQQQVKRINGKYWLLNLDKIESQTGEIISMDLVDENEIGLSTYPFDNTMVLYSKLRPYLNKVIAPSQSGYATTELVPFIPLEPLNKTYFLYLLRNASMVVMLNATSGGARMPRTKMDMMKNMCIPIPPSILQQHFALKVEAIEKQKELLRQQLADAETLMAERMQYYFS